MIAGLIAAQQMYTEPLRPQFHFTAQKGWLNDPNGLVYFRGQYHLFFQHNPFGVKWGNMTWGHAVSKDLVHWRQLAEAIEPDALGTIFSGSAVVDRANAAGFGKGALVCIYTAAGGTSDLSKDKPFTQCLAYSLDGETFRKFDGNPVLPHVEASNRDPKVFWHEPSKQWIMALYLDGSRYGIFGSKNLKAWSPLSQVEIPHASECPDFFELPIEGEKGRKLWVFWGASGYYRLGKFDGHSFTPATDSFRSNFGNTSYAAQTYFNDPKGRRIQIAWLNNSEFPDTPWNQQMGFPSELTLRDTPAGPRLAIRPVDEIRSIHKSRLRPDDAGLFACESGLMDISARFRTPASGTLTLDANGHSIAYDAAARTLDVAGTKVEIPAVDGHLDLRILVDRASVEVYAQGGLVYIPMFLLPSGGKRGLRVSTTGDWRQDRMDVFELRSAWN